MQTLKPQDQKTRLEFACQFLARLEVDGAWPWKVPWSDECSELLQQQVIPALQERQCLQTTIFMQDGATLHIGRQIKALHSAYFRNNRVISGHFPNEWPSLSPDLNLYDIWLRGFLKNRVNSGGIRTLPALKANIIRHVAEIPRALLHATIENAIMRFKHTLLMLMEHILSIL
ncbi:uncharacterized protein TNCV_1443711 [Trichonephila clavipes]|nr:uncharacterized protein TNCV_1443711 [Trichonephila clavipes]